MCVEERVRVGAMRGGGEGGLAGQPYHHHMRRPVNCLVEFRVKVI